MPKPRIHAIVPQGTNWREELAKNKVRWTNRNLDEIHQEIEDDVYARALRGENMAPIARQYGVAFKDFDAVYSDIYKLGRSVMQNESIAHMIEAGRKSGMPVMKMMGHKTALGIENLARTSDDEVTETDQNSFEISVNVIRKNSDTDE